MAESHYISEYVLALINESGIAGVSLEDVNKQNTD
jgi:hypothetical protein